MDRVHWLAIVNGSLVFGWLSKQSLFDEALEGRAPFMFLLLVFFSLLGNLFSCFPSESNGKRSGRTTSSHSRVSRWFIRHLSFLFSRPLRWGRERESKKKIASLMAFCFSGCFFSLSFCCSRTVYGFLPRRFSRFRQVSSHGRHSVETLPHWNGSAVAARSFTCAYG